MFMLLDKILGLLKKSFCMLCAFHSRLLLEFKQILVRVLKPIVLNNKLVFFLGETIPF